MKLSMPPAMINIGWRNRFQYAFHLLDWINSFHVYKRFWVSDRSSQSAPLIEPVLFFFKATVVYVKIECIYEIIMTPSIIWGTNFPTENKGINLVSGNFIELTLL